eukprot:9496705-Lingulodinium_polyedra.AAC.1
MSASSASRSTRPPGSSKNDIAFFKGAQLASEWEAWRSQRTRSSTRWGGSTRRPWKPSRRATARTR